MPTRKIRVTQITHDLAIGGLQKVVVNLCRAIDRNEFEVSVLCLRALGPFAAEVERVGIPVRLLPKKASGTDYLAFLKVAKSLRADRSDVIHTHNTQPFLDGTLGALLAGVKAIVHTDHGRQFPDKRRYMLAERLASRAAHRVVGVSEDTSSQLVRWERIDPGKVVTIVNGVDPGAVISDDDRAGLRRELGLGESDRAVGVVGRLSPEKGVRFALQAMPGVLREAPGAVLLVVGDGPEEAELERLAADLGIQARVKFLGPRSDVPAVLGCLDVYVLPSLREGLPMAILEAMAAGRPIVASGVGGVPSVVEEGVTGLLVQPGNPDRLAAAICSALADGEFRRRCRDAGPRLVRERYSVQAMARQYERLYREAAGA